MRTEPPDASHRSTRQDSGEPPDASHRPAGQVFWEPPAEGS
ncbi:hypothetical protein HTIA_1858 [Halorhabdus tiamatea SARL4B]|uniref:Uncharacterized protein n=1 Tax=Halorhabdus tiamatea SARL4B TaxID=1033806 RepID=S6D199_9EURY|nr:hypothetical protein HTIA_1858 [Halorhabdus tiamatea SARL4B]